MDLAPSPAGFDWTALLIALFAGFLLGRWSASFGSPDAAAQRKVAEVTAKITAEQRLHKLSRTARAEAERLAAEDRIIEAVKVVREDIGVGLKEAKDVVDLMAKRVS
ncbi:MAG: hypothetical protein NW216_08185 [Hyphomicrobium sp.]|nr:hypothetical protein [Hyphomicrobium sp.]